MTLGPISAANGSDLDYTAGGSITLDDIVATGSDLSFTTISGVIVRPLGMFGLLGGAPDPVPGDITMDTADLTDSTLTQSAYGSILFNWINALRSAASLTADGDILFDLVTASRSSIILDAGGSILVRNELGVNPLIQFDDGDIGNGGALDNAYLSLAAGGDIGQMDLHLFVDIPALVTLHVPNVTNYFIDALDLPPVAEPPEAVHEGTDAEGNVVQGDYLKNINWQYFYSAIEAQTPEELADWIITSLPREDWSTELDASDIAALITAGQVFTPNSLAALLDDDTYSANAIRTLLRSDPNAAQTLADALVAAITRMETITPEPDPSDPGAPVVPYDVYTMEEQQALTLLATLVGEDAMQDMAGLLSGLLTSDQILALLQKAIDESLYPSDEPLYIDEPARAFTMHIGVSTGAGYVYNEGDITITQDIGDITAGYFRSERGDMTVSALGGSIFGIANPEKEHMLARYITLNALKNIGSAAVPLVVEEQQNRPVIVVGADMTYYEPVAPGEEPMTAFGTLFGEYTPGTPVEVPILMAALATLDTTGYEFHLKQVQALDEEGLPLLDRLGNAVLVWVLEVVVRYDWLRVDYPAEATRIDAAALTGDIYIDENTGDMGVGVISAGGDVQLRAPGSLIDVRTEDQHTAGNQNITAGGDVLLDSTSGAIGTTDDRIDLAVEGEVTARAYGTICLTDTGDLRLIVESETGRIYVTAENDLTMENSVTRANSPQDLMLGLIIAGGMASIRALGSIIEGDRLGYPASVIADTINLTALNGAIGTADNPFEVDTQNGNTGSGTFSAVGRELFIAEISGDLRLTHVVSTGAGDASGDIELSAPGSIFDVTGNNAAILQALAAQKAANEARNIADQAQARADVQDTYADREEQDYLDKQAASAAVDDALTEAQTAITDIQGAIDAATIDAALTDEERTALIDELNQNLADAIANRDNLQQELLDALDAELDAQLAAQAARFAADQAQADTDALKLTADNAQSTANLLLQAAGLAPITLSAAGNLTLRAGGAIGEDGNELSFASSGVLHMTAGTGGIFLAGAGDATIDRLTAAGPVILIMLGGIAQQPEPAMPGYGASQSGPRVIGTAVGLYALGGAVGTPETPIWLSTAMIDGMAMNGGFYIRNDGALQINNIYATGDASLLATGGMTAGIAGGAAANITANSLTLTSGGAIGASGNPLILLLHGPLTAKGEDMALDSMSHHAVQQIQSSAGVTIDSDGTVMGGPIRARNLTIHAYGDIGTQEIPLSVNVSGKVALTTDLGLIFFRNTYSGGKDKKPVPPVVPVTPGLPRTGGCAVVVGTILALLSMIALGAATVYKRKYHARPLK